MPTSNSPTNIRAGALGNSVKYSSLLAHEYHADIHIQSCSLLKPMLLSPAHYKAQFLQARPAPSPAMELGSLIHTLVLEPGLFFSQYSVFPGKRDGRSQDYKSFCKANPGKVVIDDVAMQFACELRDRILNRVFRGRLFGDYLAEGEPEVTIYFDDPDVGVKCRTRIDLLHPEYVFDLKTSVYVVVREWLRHAISLDYDLQAYMYSLANCLFSNLDSPLPFVFITAESDRPFTVSAFHAGDSFMLEGRRKYREALASYAACLSVNSWPDLGAEAVLDLDHWQVRSSETPAWRVALTASAM